MKFVIAPDSFKETLTAKEAADIMSDRVKAGFPDAEVVSLPIADGGEGTAECIASAVNGTMLRRTVTYPDRSFGETGFAMLPDKTAVVDMASAAGITLTRGKCPPEMATTYGVGELIAEAVSAGAERIAVGLGGSGTHDFGCGCAAALGVRFFDGEGRAFVPVGATLKDIRHIDLSGVSLPRKIKLTAFCDVDNPPFGKNGAAFVFAPQKGAGEATCRMLDEGTKSLCEVIKSDLGVDVSGLKGGGAAGALGAGLYSFLKAELSPGIDTVLDMTGFDRALSGADLVFTGEGKTDIQTLSGKAVAGVAKRAKAAGVRAVAVVGYFDGDESLLTRLKNIGVWRIYSIDSEKRDIKTLKKTAADDLCRRMTEIIRELRSEKEI